ncbi:hypothetical protein AGLY_008007 [Aphis glycines]|uniref:Uncharacterized protein n=1 Tax=Aphis glycines TaxID=307491 RepID=A0A6G0TLY0_APHGL|nr:hypothetical protein AGLY_008007 [Aphis glycines]
MGQNSNPNSKNHKSLFIMNQNNIHSCTAKNKTRVEHRPSYLIFKHSYVYKKEWSSIILYENVSERRRLVQLRIYFPVGGEKDKSTRLIYEELSSICGLYILNNIKYCKSFEDKSLSLFHINTIFMNFQQQNYLQIFAILTYFAHDIFLSILQKKKKKYLEKSKILVVCSNSLKNSKI